MNRGEASESIGKHVVARYGTGDVMGEGRVIAYSIVPTLTIERPDGTRFDWRHDMVEEDARAQLVAEGPTPCAELNLMLKYERNIAALDEAIRKLENLIREMRR